MKRFILLQPHFIGATYLSAGSIVTEDDLNGAEPGKELVEVNDRNQAVKKEDAGKLTALGIPVGPTEIAPTSPHAPNPTQPQGLPSHGVDELEPAGNFVPADGVESDEAAEARKEQQDAATPRRRGS